MPHGGSIFDSRDPIHQTAGRYWRRFSREPFGFTDGISQPELDWRQERRTGVTELTYGNRVALGEFLLGYRNEYGNFTDRPLLDPATDP